MEKIARQLLPRQVLAQLRTYIQQHGLKTGDKLPNEREIAAQLGVSRNSVREAMKSLETVGAVVRRPKIGSVLQQIDLAMVVEIAQFQMLRSDDDLAQLYEARRLVEVSILPMVIEMITEDDLALLRGTIDVMGAPDAKPDDIIEADQAFHRALFGATRNQFLVQFGVMLQELQRDPRILAHHNPGGHHETLRDHRAIYAAIESRDLQKTQALVAHHLDTYIREGFITTKKPPAPPTGVNDSVTRKGKHKP